MVCCSFGGHSTPQFLQCMPKIISSMHSEALSCHFPFIPLCSSDYDIPLRCHFKNKALVNFYIIKYNKWISIVMALYAHISLWGKCNFYVSLDYKCVIKFVCVTAGIALLVILGTWTYFMISSNPSNVPEGRWGLFISTEIWFWWIVWPNFLPPLLSVSFSPLHVCYI